jgi:transcriptional regulator with XRE-family HTH domain
VATPEHPEDLAQLISALKDQYGVTESEIARRIGVHVSTVNNWVHRKRGGQRGPNRETLLKLSREFPKFTQDRIFAAAGRKTPGPLTPDQEAELLRYFRDLTEEQQRSKLVEVRALAEHNRTTDS